MHDGTIHGRTVRISQKEERYVVLIERLIEANGGRAWTYQEGRSRAVHVVEFSYSFVAGHRLSSRSDRVRYARGFFDAEGGVPARSTDPPYVYFAQKERDELEALRALIEGLGVACGRIHNPSVAADPDYWRFYVRHVALQKFARTIGSWHPRKAPILARLA